MMDQTKWWADCETYALFDILWKKWSVFIIFVLRHWHNTFNWILKILTKMNSKVLSERLKQLEKIWIITTKKDINNGRNIYHLTTKWLKISEHIVKMGTDHANELIKMNNFK